MRAGLVGGGVIVALAAWSWLSFMNRKRDQPHLWRRTVPLRVMEATVHPGAANEAWILPTPGLWGPGFPSKLTGMATTERRRQWCPRALGFQAGDAAV